MRDSLRHLCASLGCAADQLHVEYHNGDRSLTAAGPFDKAQVVLELPVTSIIDVATAAGALQQRSDILPNGLQCLVDLLHSSSTLVPEGSQWLLLLALFLLHRMAQPASPFSDYIQMLPTPLTTVKLSLGPAGPPSPNLLFFSASELGQLQCPALAASVREEHQRLGALHHQLFGTDSKVDINSFIWAHCLVRSRAIDLSVSGQQSDAVKACPASAKQPDTNSAEGSNVMFTQMETSKDVDGPCLVPIVDLCNHAGQQSSCCLARGSTLSGTRTLRLVARHCLRPGDCVSLDYGHHPLQHMLRQYGLVPHCDADTAAYEVFEDFGGAFETLIVQPCPQGGPMYLREVRVWPGSSSSFGGTEQSLIYTISSCGSGSLATSPCCTVLLAGAPSCPSQHAQPALPDCMSHSSCSGQGGTGAVMVPSQQRSAPGPVLFCRFLARAAYLHVVEECQQLLDQMPTSIDDDKHLLETLTQGDDLQSAQSQHFQLALHYRIARKGILQAVVKDLGAFVLLWTT